MTRRAGAGKRTSGADRDVPPATGRDAVAPAATDVAPGTDELLRMPIRLEHDIFVVRQRGREVAASIGFEQRDQVRIATALSELGRQVLRHADGAMVTFRYRASDRSLIVDVLVSKLTSDRLVFAESIAVVGRLSDRLSVAPAPPPLLVSIERALPPTAQPLTDERIRRLAAILAKSAPTTALEELAVQNQQLLAALEEVQRQRDELLRLNAELEETNHGVMALYAQLSEELEETNRGVVALYAELDERSAQLREASEAKSRFLASVSHELRAPVASIIGLARLLSDSGSHPLTAQQSEEVELISSSAADLLHMVNGLLDLAKAESGRLDPSWEQVRLADVFGQVRATARGLTSRPDVELAIEDVDGFPVLLTDPVLLTQVVRNLVTNALKFTASGEVRLGARLVGDEGLPERVFIEVSDTGVGIRPEHLERIFEEFYQVPGSVAEGGARGTGLGLPYARRLARLLGGDLVVRSEPGQGSTFTVDLPLADVDTRDPGDVDTREPGDVDTRDPGDGDLGYRGRAGIDDRVDIHER